MFGYKRDRIDYDDDDDDMSSTTTTLVVVVVVVVEFVCRKFCHCWSFSIYLLIICLFPCILLAFILPILFYVVLT